MRSVEEVLAAVRAANPNGDVRWNSREVEAVAARAAVANAFQLHLLRTQQEIAEPMGLKRCSLSHYKKKHEEWMEFHPEYRYSYCIAMSAVAEDIRELHGNRKQDLVDLHALLKKQVEDLAKLIQYE